ncbi:MAG: hypothetical protein U0Q07_08340 [Acidimicrobiales bacterium]
MSSAEWLTLVGTRVAWKSVSPPPPADLIGPVTADATDAKRLVMRYSTFFGTVWVLERRSRGPRRDVVVWGALPPIRLDRDIPRRADQCSVRLGPCRRRDGAVVLRPRLR